MRIMRVTNDRRGDVAVEKVALEEDVSAIAGVRRRIEEWPDSRERDWR
jgi:hypothetical protein